MNTVLTLTNPITINDEQGNKYTIENIAGSISIQNNIIRFQPYMHEIKNEICKIVREKAETNNEPYIDPFVLSPNDIDEDNELNLVLEEIKTKASSKIETKIESKTN